jgi:acyl carrier protein
MAKKEITLREFRETMEQMIEGDRLLSGRGKNNEYLEALNKIRQVSDEDLLKAKLYADLGLDSLDLWENVCMLERDYDVHIDDEIDEDFGTGVGLTVEKYLQAVNKYQIDMENL